MRPVLYWYFCYKRDLQKTQNKMLRFLNKSRVVDKVNTKSILDKFNLVSVNQLNAQIKLTETWKSLNLSSGINKNGISALQITHVEGHREMRSAFKGNLIENGKSKKAKKTFINDSARVWNNAPKQIKSCVSLSLAKKEIKAFVKTLPI